VFNLAVHSLIGHKEYRFVELTSAALVLLAAIGSVNVWQWVEKRRGTPLPTWAGLVGLVIAWGVASAWVGQGKPLDRWFGKSSHGPELVYLAGRDPRVCGLAGIRSESWQFSRAYLDRPVPIILLDHTPRPRPRLKPPGRELESVNAVIAPAEARAIFPGYSLVKCKGSGEGQRCLLVRPGPCRPTPEARDREIQKVMIEKDW
jgi:hypothetical protein